MSKPWRVPALVLPSLRRVAKRRYAFLIVLIVILTATALAYRPKPDGRMVAVNGTAQANSVCLTLDTGGTVEYAMPPTSAVILAAPTSGTVTGAVIFDQHCVVLVEADFGPRVFGAGGQLYDRGIHDAGFTEQHYDGAMEAAVAGSPCVGVTLPPP